MRGAHAEPASSAAPRLPRPEARTTSTRTCTVSAARLPRGLHRLAVVCTGSSKARSSSGAAHRARARSCTPRSCIIGGCAVGGRSVPSGCHQVDTWPRAGGRADAAACGSRADRTSHPAFSPHCKAAGLVHVAVNHHLLCRAAHELALRPAIKYVGVARDACLAGLLLQITSRQALGPLIQHASPFSLPASPFSLPHAHYM